MPIPAPLSKSEIPPEEAKRFFCEGFSLPLLYLSPHFAVIAKPAGMPLYPTQKTKGKTLEDYLRPQKRGGPWLAHRLDQDTAGCLLIARRKTALTEVQTLFANPANRKNIRKIYWAVLEGKIDPALGNSGEITLPLRKIRQGNKWRMQACPHPEKLPPALKKECLPAKTKWKKLGETGGKTWMELELLTGRTHQARVHCLALGSAILGDPVYSAHPTESVPLCLLARSLFLQLPSGETIKAEMNPPDFMQKYLRNNLHLPLQENDEI